MSSVSCIVEGQVATLTLNSPQTCNAIDITIIREIHRALDKVQRPRSGALAVVLTGSGTAFCSGVDLHSVNLNSLESRQRAHFEMRRFLDPLILRLSEFHHPIVAAVNGAATGAGMSLALACDIIVMSEDAVLWPSFAHLGLVPDAGVTFRLARRIGGGRSLAALLLAEKIDAQRAEEWGLAYSVVPGADVLAQSQSIARRLAAGPQAVLGQIRHLHASAFDNSLQEQLRAERSAQEMVEETSSCVEGVRAFFEKREPHFESHRS
jgi:2-(1,2-epoxy-1,2-dihydrophenyl)acetyl-CoA isomerase